MKLVVATLSLLLGVAWAQQVVDPLQRLETEPGDFSYFVSLSYFPGGDSTLLIDEAGEDVFITEVFQDFGLSFGGSYSLNSDLSFSASLSPSFSLSTVEVADGVDETVTSEAAFDIGGAVAATYSFARDSDLDPAASLSLSYPFAASIDLSASFIRDPIVVGGFVGVTKPFDAPGADLLLGSSVGFVANESIDLRFGNSVSVPVGVVSPAAWSLSLRVGYALNPEGSREVGLTSYLNVREGEASLGLGIDFGDDIN